jgi:hypothetical protein
MTHPHHAALKETNLPSAAFASRMRIMTYWVTTVLVAAELGVGGVWDLLGVPYVRAVIEHLGYPSWLQSHRRTRLL